MGVKDLWKVLEPVKQHVPLQELHGQTLAVDLSLWVVEAKGVTEMQGRVTKPYLRNLFFRVNYLTQLGVELVFVVDGIAPELKLEEMTRRLQARNPQRRGQEQRIKSRSRSHFQSLINECCEMLDYMGIPYRKSIGEAEALAALMNKNGIVDGCITNDGDAFLYGAKTVYKNFTMNRDDQHVEMYNAVDIEEKLNLDREKLVAMGLLLGCDFTPKGVPGVGYNTALKFMSEVNDHHILARFREKLIPKRSNWTVPQIIDEFTKIKDRVLHSPIKPKRPRLFALQRFMHKQLEWEEEYGFLKGLPLVTLFDLRTLKRNPWYKESSNCLLPHRIVKTRVKQGVPMYEIMWYKMKKDDFTEGDYYTTMEEQQLFNVCFPDIVEAFRAQQTVKIKKTKKKGNDHGNSSDNSQRQQNDEHVISTEIQHLGLENTQESYTSSDNRPNVKVVSNVGEDSLDDLMTSGAQNEPTNNRTQNIFTSQSKENKLCNTNDSRSGQNSCLLKNKSVFSLSVKKRANSKTDGAYSVQKKNGLEAVLGEIQNVQNKPEKVLTSKKQDKNREKEDTSVLETDDFLPLSQRLILRASQQSVTREKSGTSGKDYRKSTAIILSSSDDEHDDVNDIIMVGDDNVFTTEKNCALVQGKNVAVPKKLSGNKEMNKKASVFILSDSDSEDEVISASSRYLMQKNSVVLLENNKKASSVGKKFSVIDLDDSLWEDSALPRDKDNAMFIDKKQQQKITDARKLSLIVIDDDSDTNQELDQNKNTHIKLANENGIKQNGNDKCKNKFTNEANPFINMSDITMLDCEKSETNQNRNPFIDDSEMSLIQNGDNTKLSTTRQSVLQKQNQSNPFTNSSIFDLLPSKNTTKSNPSNIKTQGNQSQTNPFTDDSCVDIVPSSKEVIESSPFVDDSEISLFEVEDSVLDDMSSLCIKQQKPDVRGEVSVIKHGSGHNETSNGQVTEGHKKYEHDNKGDTHSKTLVTKLFHNIYSEDNDEKNSQKENKCIRHSDKDVTLDKSMENDNTSTGSDKGNFSLGITLNMTSFSPCRERNTHEVLSPTHERSKTADFTPDKTLYIIHTPKEVYSLEKARNDMDNSMDRTEILGVDFNDGINETVLYLKQNSVSLFHKESDEKTDSNDGVSSALNMDPDCELDTILLPKSHNDYDESVTVLLPKDSDQNSTLFLVNTPPCVNDTGNNEKDIDKTMVYIPKEIDTTVVFALKETDKTIFYEPHAEMDNTTVFGSSQMDKTTVFGSNQMDKTTVFGSTEMDKTTVFGSTEMDKTTVFGSTEMDKTTVFGSTEMDKTTVFGSTEMDKTTVSGSTEMDKTTVFRSTEMDKTTVFGSTEMDKTTVFGSTEMDKTKVFGSTEMDKTKVFDSTEIDKTIYFGAKDLDRTTVFLSKEIDKTLVFDSKETDKTIVYDPKTIVFHSKETGDRFPCGTKAMDESFVFKPKLLRGRSNNKKKCLKTLCSDHTLVIHSRDLEMKSPSKCDHVSTFSDETVMFSSSDKLTDRTLLVSTEAQICTSTAENITNKDSSSDKLTDQTLLVSTEAQICTSTAENIINKDCNSKESHLSTDQTVLFSSKESGSTIPDDTLSFNSNDKTNVQTISDSVSNEHCSHNQTVVFFEVNHIDSKKSDKKQKDTQLENRDVICLLTPKCNDDVCEKSSEDPDVSVSLFKSNPVVVDEDIIIMSSTKKQRIKRLLSFTPVARRTRKKTGNNCPNSAENDVVICKVVPGNSVQNKHCNFNTRTSKIRAANLTVSVTPVACRTRKSHISNSKNNRTVEINLHKVKKTIEKLNCTRKTKPKASLQIIDTKKCDPKDKSMHGLVKPVVVNRSSVALKGSKTVENISVHPVGTRTRCRKS